MISDRQREARQQSDIYRNGYHKILNALILSCVIIFCLIIAIAYFVLFQPAPHYYATSLGGQLIPMTPVS